MIELKSESVLEIAEIKIKPGAGHAFEQAMQSAVSVLDKAAGFQAVQLRKISERADEYRLLVQWDRIESHTQGFQQSDLFKEWRALIGPYFSETPVVTHSKTVLQMP